MKILKNNFLLIFLFGIIFFSHAQEKITRFGISYCAGARSAGIYFGKHYGKKNFYWEKRLMYTFTKGAASRDLAEGSLYKLSFNDQYYFQGLELQNVFSNRNEEKKMGLGIVLAARFWYYSNLWTDANGTKGSAIYSERKDATMIGILPGIENTFYLGNEKVDLSVYFRLGAGIGYSSYLAYEGKNQPSQFVYQRKFHETRFLISGGIGIKLGFKAKKKVANDSE
jgi:hypothetical protein